MNSNSRGRSAIILLVSVALILSGCTTAQLQKKYTSFEGCFREQKVVAMAIGAVGGGLFGNALGGGGTRGTATGIMVALLGAVIGNRIAWQNCLDAFPAKTQTTIVNDRASTLAQRSPGVNVAQPVTKSLEIQNVSAGPLIFGKDLNVSVTYRYVSDKPEARDVKARVFRNLIFKGPDGTLQEVPSSTEDVIQQGISRATFAIPTPSIQDAKELVSTTDWVFKFAVEVEGMRQEKSVALDVPQLVATAGPGQQSPAVLSASTTVQRPAGTAPATEKIVLQRGETLYREANATAILGRLPAVQTATVLQRIVKNGLNWTQVRLLDGQESWIRGPR